jgi:3-hydroxyacyl-[acyl-carrier-protein] dehydratase
MDSDIVTEQVTGMDIRRVIEMIPHRYPFVMVDRVVELVAGVSAVAIKNVTFNEPHFQGHFPGAPVMPGVLIIESMAQTAAILVVKTLGPAAEGKLFYFMTIERARFRHPVVPGDTLHVEARKRRLCNSVWQMSCRARVGERLVAEATISGGARSPPRPSRPP